MPEDNRADDVEKVLADLKSIEDRKQGLIAGSLRQREAAIKDFDEKLAKLGYHGNSGKRKRNHHRQAEPSTGAPAQPKGKAKA